eukprot:3443215-Karenia_brevis.AAC.1
MTQLPSSSICVNTGNTHAKCRKRLEKKQEERVWLGTDRSKSRKISETWEVFMSAAASGRTNEERYVIMIGNSKFLHILKKPPYIFPGS